MISGRGWGFGLVNSVRGAVKEPSPSLLVRHAVRGTVGEAGDSDWDSSSRGHVRGWKSGRVSRRQRWWKLHVRDG